VIDHFQSGCGGIEFTLGGTQSTNRTALPRFLSRPSIQVLLYCQTKQPTVAALVLVSSRTQELTVCVGLSQRVERDEDEKNIITTTQKVMKVVF
jgi:hypothetical protein